MEDEVAAEVFFADHRVFGEFFGCALEQDFTFEEEVGTVGDGERFGGVVVGDEDADVFLFEFIHDRLDIFDGDRVDAGERFVEHDEARVNGEASGDFGTTAFATRELVAEVFANFAEVEFGYKAFELVFLLLARHVGHFEDSADIVFDGEFTEHRWFLSEVSDAVLGAFVDREFCDVEVVEENLAFVGTDEAHSHIESGSFAGAVRTEEANDFALSDVDRDVVDDSALTVDFHQVVGTEHHFVGIKLFDSGSGSGGVGGVGSGVGGVIGGNDLSRGVDAGDHGDIFGGDVAIGVACHFVKEC